MSLRIRNLASGSAGNATLVEARGSLHTTRLLIDCGVRPAELERRLQRCDLSLTDLDAVFITHEHSDHVGHARTLVERHAIPLWMSDGTRRACEAHTWALQPDQLHLARDGDPVVIQDLCLRPFTVPHDAREPLQLRCTDGDRVLGVVTDLGHVSRHVVESLQACHALFLETNHEPERVRQSSYPEFLKRRILGDQGHLSNAQAADLLSQVLHPKLRTVIAAHLSERNNAPGEARAALSGVLGCAAQEVPVADQTQGSDWFDV
jgi:phosphoribosyl 1,2-cyclic phosphodiesterase